MSFGDHPLEEEILVSPGRTIRVTGKFAVDWRNVRDTDRRDEWLEAFVAYVDEARRRHAMSDLVPYKRGDNRSYDEQLRDALEQALTIQGTVINDLESAINCILQMERGMRMTGTPNPVEAKTQYLKNKYKMTRERAERQGASSRRLLEKGDGGLAEGNDEPLELLRGEIVDD